MDECVSVAQNAAEIRQTRKEIIAGAFDGERLTLSRVRSQVPEGHYTKAMFMEKTGLTSNEFRALRAAGKLEPVGRSRRGWALWNDTSIDKLKASALGITRQRKLASLSRKNWRSYSAQEGVAVFREIEKGTPLASVAIEHNLHPTIVAAIREDYVLLNRAVLLPKVVMDTINRLEGKIEGVFPIQNAEDMLRLIERLTARVTCGTCHAKPKRYCVECAREKFSMRMRESPQSSAYSPQPEETREAGGPADLPIR